MRVTLDGARWRIVGDFELAVDFELVSLPQGPGPCRMDLIASTNDEMDMANVGVHVDRSGASVVATYYREGATRPLAGDRGSLRIVRSGTDVRMIYRGNRGEETLLVRPHVGPGMDFSFRLEVEGAAGCDPLTVAFDNLRVTPVSPR